MCMTLKLKWGICVPLDLGTLVLYTGAHLMANILVYARPCKPGSNKFLHCLDSGVEETMRESNTVVSPHKWYQCSLNDSVIMTVE